MAFNNYLEDENDKPYFTTNSLAYYYDKMEGFAKAVEGSAKALNLTKEEIEQRIALRLAEWDKNLESFDGSVEKLLTEWVDDGTLTHVIDSTLIDQKIAPVTARVAETVKVVNVKNYGAIGDGIVDDTLAIRTAINALNEGDELYFPKTTAFYKVSVQAENAIFTINKAHIKITGNSRNGIYSPTIKVLGTLVKETGTVFEFLADGLEIQNLAVWGGELNNKRVGDCFRTGANFQSKLYFSGAFAAHCFNNGFNLTAYFLTMVDCQARFVSNAAKTGSGFNIHGRLSDGLEGTTVNQIGCFTDYVDIGYNWSYITYSHISGCASDHAGEAAYKMFRCYEVVGSGMGAEAIYKKAVLLDTCLNVKLTGVRPIIDPTKDGSYAFTLKSCTNCVIEKIRLNSPVFAEIIYGSVNTIEVPTIASNVIDNTFTLPGYESYQHKFIPITYTNTTETITASQFYEMIQDTTTSGTSSLKQVLKHVYLERDYTLSVLLPSEYTVQTQTIMKRIKGVRGSKSLIIKGVNANKNLNLLDVGTIGNFVVENNEAEIIFENITFYSYYQGSTMFTFKNTKVRFKNCVIRPIGNDPSYRALNIFKLENAKVVIEEDTQILGSSDNFFANKDNNSSIEIIKPTGTLPKNHEYLIENPTVIGQLKKYISETCINVKTRKGSTAYVLNDVAVIGDGLYRATTAGTTSAESVAESPTITDGTVNWKFISTRPFKVAFDGISLTVSDYVLIDGKGLFRVTVAGTIDSVLNVSDATTVGQTIDISANGVKARKVAMNGLLTT